jgi:pimeloyl-ACP methyl ester carboxylesterase
VDEVLHTEHDVVVDGAVVRVLEAGDPTAPTLLFLHGWGLTPACYLDGIYRLTAAGVRVVAPCLPGFGGSDALPLDRVDLPAYAFRVARLLEALGEDGPVFVAGHSFGGGVALQLATDRPDLVRSLTLVCSVGGARRSRPASWAGWAAGALAELDPQALARCAPSVLRAFLPNVVRRPVTLALTARLALTAALGEQAQALVAGGVPVLFVWGDRDRLIARGALGDVVAPLPAQVVRGRHGWLLDQPEQFADLLRNALVVHAMLERRAGARGARSAPAGVLPPGRRLTDLLPPLRAVGH